MIEGATLLSEALSAGFTPEAVFVAPDTHHVAVDAAIAAGVPVHHLASGVLERVADTVTPQPIAAIVPSLDVSMSQLSSATLLVVCVDVRDPGNAGTILRGAEAAGAGGVIFCDGSVDVFNPKTVRASAGALFHMPVVAGGEAGEVLEEMARCGMRRLATVSRGGTAHDATDLTVPIAFVLGNEASGLPTGLDDAIDDWITIPMVGRSESLNVGMAATVLCFEAARQRHG